MKTMGNEYALYLADTTEKFLNALMLQYEARQQLIAAKDNVEVLKAQKMEGDAELLLRDLHRSLRTGIAQVRRHCTIEETKPAQQDDVL